MMTVFTRKDLWEMAFCGFLCGFGSAVMLYVWLVKP
jgi:hypothetical protein